MLNETADVTSLSSHLVMMFSAQNTGKSKVSQNVEQCDILKEGFAKEEENMQKGGRER